MSDATVTLWSVGHNMPGYMPMADEPTLCTSWEDAKNALDWEMYYMLDFLMEGIDHEDSEEVTPNQEIDWHANLAAARADLATETGPEYGTIVDDCPSGTSYWIVQETMTVAEATEYGVEL